MADAVSRGRRRFLGYTLGSLTGAVLGVAGIPPELFDAERQVLFVAARNVRDGLDWRVPVVSCGRQEGAWAALGWAALLLREISRRRDA